MNESTYKIFQKRFRETFNETLNMLNEKGKCVVIRPTGFGKTVLMCKIALLYGKVLYVYPTEAVGQQAGKRLDNSGHDITWMTYTKIGKQHNDVESLTAWVKQFDLIIFDEIHHMGANYSKETLEKLLPEIDGNVHILGCTATPRRMDGYDVIDSFFDNCIISRYGLGNAIDDCIMQKFLYIYALDKQKKIKVPDKKLQSDSIRDSVKKLAKLTNASEIIRNGIMKATNKSPANYMRFIVFCTTKEILAKRTNEVKRWFTEAFPTYTIREPLQIVSSSNSKRKIEELMKLDEPDNTIDIIMSINMLNEGYHLGALTGVILLRPTQSPVVYTQQIGRCTQIGQDNTPIIFDFVANIKIRSIFDMEPVKVIPSNKLEEQLDTLSDITPQNVDIIDVVASAKEIMLKINEALNGVDGKFLALRKKQYPASAIRDELGIKTWEVYQLLDKYDAELRPLGLQRQEADNYEKGYKAFGAIEE